MSPRDRSKARSGNLPAELSAFIGRVDELHRLADIQSRSRLLTLAGPGGVGKTRLSLQLARRLHDTYPDGIWVVDLAPLAAPSMVPQAVADTLSVHEHIGLSWTKALTNELHGRRLLLLLDNCEHVLEGCVALVSALLSACPKLHIVATSRQPLGLGDETVWRVAPLSLPTDDALQASDAVHLFLERAATRAAGLVHVDGNQRLVADICRRLDGLPLALELVAALVEGLDLADIAARVGMGLGLRAQGRRTAPVRHQTLRATFDWSYQLLDEHEQRLWIRLGVFVSGWTADAARTVCSDAIVPAGSVMTLLDRLVAGSLVVRERRDGSERYRMLEMARAYALEQLEATHEVAMLRDRHAQYVLALAEQVSPDSTDAAHAELLDREQAEIRAALGWLLEQGQAEDGLRLASRANLFWYLRGHASEGCTWLERLLALPAATVTPWRATALRFLGQLLVVQGEYRRAEERFEAALDGFAALDDPLGIALSLGGLGAAAMWRGDLSTARALLDEAVDRLRELGDVGEFGALVNAATVAVEMGDGDRALALAADLEERGKFRQPHLASVWSLLVRAGVAERDGSPALAESLLTRALELERPLGYVELKIALLTELGHVLLDLGKAAAARATVVEPLQTAYDTGRRRRLIRALECAARSIAPSQPSAAVRLMGSAAGLLEAITAKPWPRDGRRTTVWLPVARRALGETAYHAACETGRLLSVDETVRLARGALAEAERLSDVLLTARQRQVAELLAQGRSTRQIAAELVISVATVRVHVDHLMAKLDLHSRTQVALWVRERAGRHAPANLSVS
jgi:predicted ATPase/DNA-binding CsgD family transcriptional regulator